jgi:hypothetical protein
MPGQQIASMRNDLPALAKVPDWTPPPDAAASPSSPASSASPASPPRYVARLASPGLDASPGKERPPVRDDGLGEAGADWPPRFARMLTEALAGARPAGQILPWTSKRARSQFLRLLRAFSSSDPGSAAGRTGSPARGRGQPQIVRVVATRPARDAIEMSVIARFGERVRALALRLERIADEDCPGQWVCTDIEAA